MSREVIELDRCEAAGASEGSAFHARGPGYSI